MVWYNNLYSSETIYLPLTSSIKFFSTEYSDLKVIKFVLPFQFTEIYKFSVNYQLSLV